jgi:AcrR family transcriptional regulator
MEKTEARRRVILEKIADHLLEQGMKGSSLRPLAAAAGISDRMLLHYFENKEEVMTAALHLVASRMTTLLEGARSAPMPFHTLMPHLAGMRTDPNVRPYLRLWLELAALSASGEEAYRQVARQLGDYFYAWLTSELLVEKEEERASLAALAFVTIEGFVFLDAIGENSLIESALNELQRRQ